MTHESIIDSRLTRLERQNRSLRAAVVLMAFCLTGGLLLGAVQSGVFGTVTAEKINIVDKDGKNVISIGVGELGTGLAVYRTDGSRAAVFGMSNAEQAGGLALFDAEGRGRIGVGMDEGTPSLAIADPEGHKRVSLGGTGDRYGFVVMDAGQKQRAGLGVLDGRPVCLLSDENGVAQIGMSKTEAGGYRFSMLDKEGHAVELDE